MKPVPNSLRDVLVDKWAALSYRRAFRHGSPALAVSWVPKAHARRLAAYTELAAIRENCSRLTFAITDPEAADEYREYGDADLILETIRAAVLGDIPMVQVEGADGEPPREPTEDDVTDGSTLEALRAEWEQERSQRAMAVARQEWFDRQFKLEKVAGKIIACEDNVVGLGDGVYWLTWHADNQRVRVRQLNPGFYFPVYDDNDDEFPNRVHFAWEYEDDDNVKWVRRITHDRVRLPSGETRRYPYAPDVDSGWTVRVTDATWRYQDLGSRRVDDFDLSRSVVAVNGSGQALEDYDLGIDYIPILHVPNTVEGDTSDPWGRSSLLRVAQVVDDIATTDTDLIKTGRLLGSPPLTAGPDAVLGDMTSYGPGSLIPGDVKLLDTSKSLDALLKLSEHLLSRLSVNRQLPASILGRIDQSEIKSGIHLLLTFGPFRTLIEGYRLARADKYELLFKMWQRLAIVGRDPDLVDSEGGAVVLSASLKFGSYLPNDTGAVIDQVRGLHKAKLMSTGTSIRILQANGVEYESIDDELDAVKSEDFDGAVKLAEALASEQAAADYLGVNVADIQSPTVAAPQVPPPSPPV